MPQKTTKLSEWVRTARGPHTIPAFAELSGISTGSLSELESSKADNPLLRTLEAIAAASDGRCAVTLGMPQNDSIVDSLLEKAKRWRNTTDDPHRISLGVSVALQEVAAAMSGLRRES